LRSARNYDRRSTSTEATHHVSRRLSIIAIVSACLLGASGYAIAQEQEDYEETIRDAREAREESRAEQAALAGGLDVLEAEDDELLAALVVINDQVEAQQLRVGEAQAELERIRSEIAGLRDQIVLTRQRSIDVRNQATRRVILTYVQPTEPLSSSLLNARDLHEGTRRQTLFRFATLGDLNFQDELRAVDDDLVVLRQTANRKEGEAVEQEERLAVILADLEVSRGIQRQLRDALQDQIGLIEDQLAEMERQERELGQVIRQAQAALQAQKAREAAERARNAQPNYNQQSPAGFIMPAGGWITSGFGTRRHPILGTIRNHAGVDISGGTGNPVWAAQSGVVITAGSLGGYGKTVIIDHGGYRTLYAHMNDIKVRVGDEIAQGTRVGDIGSTGLSTGPHLHFEVRIGGVAQDPAKYLP